MYAETLEAPAVMRLGAKPSTLRVDDGRASELCLVERVRARDEAAFREVVECYQNRVYRIVGAILHDRQNTEDVAQEVFAKVYFSIHGFSGRCSLFSWIYRIAVNESYAFLRKRRVRTVGEGELGGDEQATVMQMFPDNRPTVDRVLAGRDLVNKLLARLPEEDRLLLLWKEVEGFSVSELASMSGLNENTVKTRLLRTRRRLAVAAARLARIRRRTI